MNKKNKKVRRGTTTMEKGEEAVAYINISPFGVNITTFDRKNDYKVYRFSRNTGGIDIIVSNRSDNSRPHIHLETITDRGSQYTSLHLITLLRPEDIEISGTMLQEIVAEYTAKRLSGGKKT